MGLAGGKKLSAAGLRPIFRAPADKSNMPPMGWGLKIKIGALIGDLAREALIRKEGIIESLDHQGGGCDGWEVGFATGPGPIVAGIAEAVERGGEEIIKLGEGFDFSDSGEIESVGEGPVFVTDLLL